MQLLTWGEEMCLIQMDLENAFNLQARRTIFDALVRIAPGLVRFFRALYGEASGLYLGSGEWVGNSETGVRQGDPMAMLYFSVGIQATLVAIQEAVQAIKVANGSTLPAGVYGYADDTSIFIGEKGAHEAIKAAMVIVQGTRMRVKVTKSKVLVRPGRLEYVRPPRVEEGSGEEQEELLFESTEEGIVVLGNPVGTDGYRRAALSDMLATMGHPLPALTRVDSQATYFPLQLCFDARPYYLARVLEPRLYWAAMGTSMRR